MQLTLQIAADALGTLGQMDIATFSSMEKSPGSPDPFVEPVFC
jgi:hypothetical protein